MALTICLSIVTAAFVILVIFLCLLAAKLRNSLQKVDLTLTTLRPQLQELGLISQTIGLNLQNKLKAIDPLFHSASILGERLEHHISTYKQKEELKCKLEELTEEESENTVSPSLELIALGILLWQNLHKKR